MFLVGRGVFKGGVICVLSSAILRSAFTVFEVYFFPPHNLFLVTLCSDFIVYNFQFASDFGCHRVGE